jgi:ATP-dependent DNA ligase
MSLFANAIFSAEKISTRNEKFKALSGFGPAEKKLLWETFNPFRVFGVRQYEFPRTNAAVDPSFDQFFALLDLLATRKLTGNIARDAVTLTLSKYTELTARALARVLNKDLECGASRESFEKIYPDLTIPKFELMLAGKIDENAKTLTTEILAKKYGLVFPVIAESKYDGNRLLAVVKRKVGGLWDIEFLSRSGKPSTQYNEAIVDELIALAEHVKQEIVVDGEILARSFQETMNAKGSGNLDAKNALSFFVFDWMTLAEWEANSCPRTQLERSNSLEKMVNELGCVKLVKSKYKICHDLNELKEFYAEVLAEGQNSDGSLNGLGEGLIIKDPNGYYEWERSSVIIDRKTKKVTKPIFWVKWKPVIDLDLEFVGWEYGSGRLAETVGRINLRGKDENGRLIECSCGSGLDDKMRDYILKNHAKLLGKIVCIEAQEITLAAGATVYSVRFPIFIRFRDDK